MTATGTWKLGIPGAQEVIYQGGKFLTCLAVVYRVYNPGPSTVEVNGIILGAGTSIDVSVTNSFAVIVTLPLGGSAGFGVGGASGTYELLSCVCCCSDGTLPREPVAKTRSKKKRR